MSTIKTREPGSEFQSLVPAKLPSSDGQRRRRMVWSDDSPTDQEKDLTTNTQSAPVTTEASEPIKESVLAEPLITTDAKVITRELEVQEEALESRAAIQTSKTHQCESIAVKKHEEMHGDVKLEMIVDNDPSDSEPMADDSLSPEDRILLNFYKKQAQNKKRKPTNDLIQEEIDRIKSYCAIPQWLSNAVNKLGLSTNPAKVLDALIRLAINYKDLEVRAGYSILISMSGVHKQNLGKAIAKLESLDLVKRKQHGYNENSVYRIIFLEPFKDITFNPSLLRNQKDAKPAIDIPREILIFIDRRNLSPAERDAAIEVTTRSLEEGVSAGDILRVYEYVYRHGMVGTKSDDSFEGSKPTYPFRYLLKAFGFVLDRVKKNQKKEFASSVEKSKNEYEASSDSIGASEAIEKFNNAYPDEIEREKALKSLVAAYRRNLSVAVKDINFPDSAAIIAWAQSK